MNSTGLWRGPMEYFHDNHDDYMNFLVNGNLSQKTLQYVTAK